MKRLLPILMTVLLFCLLAPAYGADDRATAEGLVKKAIAFYKANGPEKLIEEVANSKGQFVQGTIYVYILTGDGTMLAHPTMPHLNGQNTMGVKDVDGKSINQRTFEAGNGKTSPWIEYSMKHPKTGLVEPKMAYVEKADDIFFVSGFYKK